MTEFGPNCRRGKPIDASPRSISGSDGFLLPAIGAARRPEDLGCLPIGTAQVVARALTSSLNPITCGRPDKPRCDEAREHLPSLRQGKMRCGA